MEQEDGSRKCYYEIMGFDFDPKLEESEIRRAYKKLSLKYHPDKNINDPHTAMIRFKEVQAAYAVLMDTNERAWYDSHRDGILRGDANGTSQPDELNVFDYMTPRCYTGFGDDEDGFFQTYARVFVTIAKEEAAFDDKTKFPAFGTSSSDWVKSTLQFYNFWSHYSSRKSFSWKDEYKTTDIPDRMTRRAAERHNQKERDTARREYTAALRELVAYVKERDPRVKAERERRERDEAEKEDARQEREYERKKAAYASKQKIWEEAAALEEEREKERQARGEFEMDGSQLEMLYAKEGLTKYFHEEGEQEETKAVEYRCPICKKSFKTLAQWKEHIGSNKHKTKAKQMTSKGTDVEAMILEANPHLKPKEEESPAAEASPASPASAEASPKGGKKHVDPTAATNGKKKPAASDSDDDEEGSSSSSSSEEEMPQPTMKPKGGKKGRANKGNVKFDAPEEETTVKPKGGKKNKKFAPQQLPKPVESSSDDDSSSEDEAPRRGGFSAFGALNSKKKGKR